MTARVALAALAAAMVATAAPAGDTPALLLGPGYPLELVVREHVGRFHWLDSLAGLDFPGGSAGKTVPAHREEFLRRLGRPTDADRLLLRRFAEVRVRFAEGRLEAPRAADEGGGFSDLLIAVLEADHEAAALEAAAALLPEEDVEALAVVLDHFRARYRGIWKGGAWLEPFLRDVRDGSDAAALAADLARAARFYGVETPLDPVPRVVVVPVPAGYGTHATAQGRNLLIELRPEDRLADAASVLVHENAHVLFERMPAARRAEVEAVFREHGEAGEEAWRLLREALPTALGQGVADRRFRPSTWDVRAPWYHREDVDRYAKAIYPAVRRALAGDGLFDRDLARALWAAWPDRGRATPPGP